MKTPSFLQKVILITSFCHLAIIGLAFILKTKDPSNPKKALVVRSITELKPQVIKTKEIPKPTAQKKQETKPNPQKNKSVPKPKPIAQTKIEKKEPIQKELPKQKKVDLNSDSLVVPTLKPVQPQLKKEVLQTSIQDILEHLQSYVVLPKKAFIKVKLKIDREGLIENVEILDSADEENSQYIKETLAHLSLKIFELSKLPEELIISFQGI